MHFFFGADKLPSGATVRNTVTLPVNLPLQSLEDLTILEEALTKNEDLENCLVCITFYYS